MDVISYILAKNYVDETLTGAGALKGKSAYEVAVTNGFEGSESEWLQSLEAITPHIGENGNWYLEDTDTGILAAPELSDKFAYVDEDNSEDIVIVETASPFAGTIHRFSVEVNCAPLYIPEDNLSSEFADDYQPYTDYGVLIFPDSYTDKGKKTRLVISAHGGGGKVDATTS